MAVYFDNRIQSSSVTANTDLLWHNSYALLAVASENAAGVGGSVNFFLDEGELLEESSIQRSSLVSSMSWHPVRKIIAVGWASGELLMWNEHDRELHEVYSIHKVKINTTLWSQSGHRLVTGDEDGLLAIWKSDTKGRLSQAPLYQHNCGSAITYCLFKPPHTQENAIDMAGLARAAVNGDEKALDMFSWTNGPKLSSSLTANSFFFGTADGSVFHVDDKGHSTSSFSVDGRVKTLLYYEGKDVLVTVTENMMLTQHTIEPDGTTNEIMKVKISAGSGNSFIIWAGQGVLATASGEAVIRILDLDHDDNYVLSLDTGGYDNGECISCIAYAKGKGILAAGTNMGKVAMWHALKYKTNVDGEKRWELFPPSIIQEPVLQLQWGGGKGLLGVNVGSSVVILNEQVMNVHFNDMVAAIQISPSQLTIENFATDYCQDLKTDIHIKGVYIIKDHAIVWDGKRVVVYEVSTNATLVRAAGSFASDSLAVVAHDQSVYTVEPGKIQVRNVQGTVKQLLAFHESEGDPILIDVCGSFLVSGTSLGYIKIWALSRREAKQHGSCKSFETRIPGVGKIKSVKINCNGTKVCVICEKDESTNDPRLFIWDVDLDLIQCFDFATGRNDHAIENEGNERSLEVSGRYPTIQYWDPNEPKLLVCQAVLAPLSSVEDSGENGYDKTSGESNDMNPDVIIVTLFSTPENGIILLDNFPEEEQYTGFLGLQVPYLYFAIKRIEAPEEKKGAGGSFVPLGPRRMATKRTMRDFVGLEDGSAEAKQAMINFSYLSAIGNMDEAFKAIKLIKSESVWENMARMCVKTKRLDVAAVCLGNMKNARAAKALRKAMKEPEHDARVAMLAIQLNMLDEGEKLYKSCKRYDLLNKFYQARNEWSKAIEVAELHDRVHLRTTYYNFAKFLESSGNVQGAVANYEKSDTFRFEVPRMLLENPNQLESYIMKTKDTSLRKWWAQYMESNSEMEVALKYYEAANDILSLVRVYCFCGNIEKASEICNETGDRAASYHLARQFENQDSIREAIHFYTRAQRYSNAIRLAKENGLDNELMNLALLSKPQDMIDVARYYENVPDMVDKAVVLYHKGGEISKALDLCFKTEQFSALELVAEDLTENTDPEMLTRCSEFFMQHGQYDKAVDLAVLGKKYAEAMDLCLTHNVIITEELAEKMTLPKDSNNSELRNKILERIAECCMQQGSYHMATKKFTQAGNKVKAMKALLKSGDTEKIVFFAGVSRQREIYVMAANYLQSLDWRKDPDIMKNIIGFYTKGRALDSLASFYDACAQVEIDEYQNYEKALGALSESYKCLGKAKVKDASSQEEKMAFIKQRIGLIKKFIQAKMSYEEDAEEAMKQCQILIEEPDLETAVRIGDVYGIMVEHLAREENYSKAYSLMQDLRQRMPSANMSFYVSMRTIEVIHKSLDIPLGRGMGGDEKPVMNGGGGGGGGSEDEGEELEEELEEEVREDLQNGYD